MEHLLPQSDGLRCGQVCRLLHIRIAVRRDSSCMAAVAAAIEGGSFLHAAPIGRADDGEALLFVPPSLVRSATVTDRIARCRRGYSRNGEIRYEVLRAEDSTLWKADRSVVGRSYRCT